MHKSHVRNNSDKCEIRFDLRHLKTIDGARKEKAEKFESCDSSEHELVHFRYIGRKIFILLTFFYKNGHQNLKLITNTICP